jgi:hypothetical protein
MSTISSISGRIGAITASDGSVANPFRQAKTGEALVSQAHGKYYEAAHRGSLFAAQEQGTGVATAQTISTTAILSLYNPAGSGKRLAVKKVSLGYISGTLGPGTFYHCVNNSNSQAAPSSGTVVTPLPCDIGNAATPVGLVRANATVASGTVAYRAFASAGAFVGGANNAPAPCTEDIDGEIVVEPGCSYQLQAVLNAAGTSPKVSPGIVWEEIPIV